MRILHVERDESVAQSVALMLRVENCLVETVGTGEVAVELATLYDYDLILLELCLPDISGTEVLRRLRLAKVTTPVLVLTGCAALEDKVKAFSAGADDYLTKPFHRDELAARVAAIVRRTRGFATPALTIGDLVVDLDRKLVTLAGTPVHLTGKEYEMLELLALRKGRTVTKEMFLHHLYGGRDAPEIKIIDVFVCKMRAKFARVVAGGGAAIETVWGRGFTLRQTPLDEDEIATSRFPRNFVTRAVAPAQPQLAH